LDTTERFIEGKGVIFCILNRTGVSMPGKVTIKIPRELYHKFSQMIEGTGFSSVTEFVVFAMQRLASSSEINGRIS